MPKKTIYVVYQDCVFCGDKGEAKRLEVQELQGKGYKIIKVPFTSAMARDLIHEAVINHRLGSMPFYTDGENFSYDLSDIVKAGKKRKQVEPDVKEANGADKKTK